MTRKMYVPTEGQEKRWERLQPVSLPSDDEFKDHWKKKHGGKVKGWGIAKRDWIVSNLKMSRDYQMGLWQGRVDKARGLEYSEERIDKAYNLGYFRGYSEYESNRHGWDNDTCARFDEKYVNN